MTTADRSLFPDIPAQPQPPAVEDKASAGRRLTQRQATDIKNGRHPLADHGATLDPQRTAAGHTCGDCAYRVGGTYPKCLHRAPNGHPDRITGGPATDCRAHWPACRDWTPPR